MPTTCFLLTALWGFSKSSVRFHTWLWEHKHLGPPLQRWQKNRQIPLKAKVVALVSMAASMSYIMIFANLSLLALSIVSGFLLLSAFIVYRLPTEGASEGIELLALPEGHVSGGDPLEHATSS